MTVKGMPKEFNTAHVNGVNKADRAEGTGETMVGHGEFFDADGDGIFWPIDTFRGFRALGFGLFLSVFSAIVIMTMSYPSSPSWIPDPFFRIHVALLHRAKHGSDSGSFKRDGDFDEEAFDEFFDSCTEAPHKKMTPVQLWKSVSSRRVPYDFYGSSAAAFEWLATWILLGYPSFHFDLDLALKTVREEGINNLYSALSMACNGGDIKKEDVKGVYDGTLFYNVMDKEAEKGNGAAISWKNAHERSRERTKAV